ncbi:hypothetical protein FJZ22_00345 [Candidatus Pacearchaeota archaeon]|nr:hypothetical protein [Candidatus Pacearchaeota archaeon]
MLILKLLGGIDLIGAGLFILLVFGVTPFLQLTLFSAGLLLLKSMFILTGDPLSIVDFLAGILLLLSLFYALPTLLVWTPALLLLAKGAGSML